MENLTRFEGFSLVVNAFDLHKIEPLIMDDKKNFCVSRKSEMEFKINIRRIEDCEAIESLLGWH